MQLGILNFLLGLPAGNPGAVGHGNGEGAPLDLFSQLLGDSGMQGNQQQTAQAAPTEWFSDLAPGTLVAQEVGVTDLPAEDVADLEELLGHEITPEEATDLLNQLETLSADVGGDTQHMPRPLVDQLKATLTEIKETKQPQTVGAVLAQLPAPQAQHLANDRPNMQRVLAWVKHTINHVKTKDAPTQEATVDEGDEDSVPSATVQSLQAAMFRDAPAPVDEAAPQEIAETREYVEIVPLSNTITAEPAWIKHIAAAPSAPAIAEDHPQAGIPSLKIAQDDLPLPAVNLPGSELKAAEMPKEFVPEMTAGFEPIVSAPVGTERAKPDTLSQPVMQNMPADATSSTLTAGAVAATDHAPRVQDHRAPFVATPHVVNHAPVAEQVHVAVRRATVDGIDQMTIQLEPADLGRVEVKMHMSNEGQTHITFTVDKAETLDALSRDARGLERSLQEAGVKADAGNMQFNLRQQPQFSDMHGDGQNQRGPQWDDENEESASVAGPQAAAAITRNYTIALHDGVDIRA